MRIPKALMDEMIAHALEDDPDECCGMIGGLGDDAVSLFRIENTAHSPLRYEMNSDEQLKAYLEITGAGHDVVAIYHSHTRSAAYPSQTDVNLAGGWPDSVYLIVSLENKGEPYVKGFWIRDGEVEDAVLQVV